MLHSLRGRLILLMGVGLIFTGGLALLFISRAIEHTFVSYVTEQENARLERVEGLQSILPEMLSAYYSANPNRANLDQIIRDLDWLIPGSIIVTNPNNPTSASRQLQANSTNTFCETLLPVIKNGQAIGQVCFESVSSSLRLADAGPFRNSVQDSLVAALLVAGGLALLLTIGFAGHLLKPLDALTQGVRTIDRGQTPTLLPSGSITELRELTTAFNDMAERLEQTETLRQNMVSDVAHELRTPLTNVCGYLEALEDGVVQYTPELVHSLTEEAQLLTRLVDDLQDLALAEAGKIPIHREPIQICQLISTALQVLQLPADKKSVELAVESNGELPFVSADELRIGQVLRNLIDNAVAHAPDGGKVTVRTSATDEEMTVSVNNTGEPISAAHLPFLFERFYRADQARARATGGYGLGLAIVKQLIEAHGGTVGVRSEPTSGTSFFFTLPLATEISLVQKM